MISFVKGTVADIGENCLVVENGGIGYEIYMTGQDLGKARIGDEKKIHTFLYVREDILQLYGFFSKDDLGMFKLLIGVNGVGPKGALGILSGISAARRIASTSSAGTSSGTFRTARRASAELYPNATS